MAVTINGTTGVTTNNSVYTDASGNTGIGTTSPSYKLQVYGASNPEMRLGDATVTYQLYTEGATAAVMGTVTNHALVLRTNATERMRIDTSGNLLFNSGYGSVATAYGCRAWVNFIGSTAVIRASGNVTSITRTSTGVYTVNFTTAMPDTNYSVNITSQTWTFTANDSSLATGSCVVKTSNTSTTAFDGNPVCVLIFR